MKKIIVLILSLLIIIPASCNALKLKNGYKDFAETVAMEGITKNKKGYAEKADDVEVILFWGNGCPHCYDFIEFLNNFDKEYDHIKLRSYEVWYDSNNSSFLQSVAKELGIDVKGVPFIIIGDKYFFGFGPSNENEIKDLIKTIYETPVKSRKSFFGSTSTVTTTTTTTTTAPITTTNNPNSLTTSITTTTNSNNQAEEKQEEKQTLFDKYKYFILGAWVVLLVAFGYVIFKEKKISNQ